MKCSNCGHENPKGSVQCEKCNMALIEVTAKLDTMVEGKKKSDPLDFSPGEKFGKRYQVIEEIGSGGMGKVFKARDLELNITVALKMIKPELSSDPDIISRFKRELLLAREILHENVIRIHDLGEIDHIRYISMNYIEGNSLKEIIQSTGKLTIEKSIDIAKQVCSALTAAHKKGIVHRDLKPQNIMIDKKGNAFVLDFGIARSIAATGETEEGIVMGTPDFMSPEQIRGKKADAVSDIYSLGIIMYEMVTGKLPFKADNPTALLYLHLNEQPELPSKLNPLIPKKLETIILKCMEKKKKDRYSSIEKVMEELLRDKTGQIRTIKETKKQKRAAEEVEDVQISRGNGKFFKHIGRFFLLLIILYAVIFAIGMVNDMIYKGELDKIKVEDDTHYKTVFPVQKDWLPAGWEVKDGNSWDTYTALFPPKTRITGETIPDEEYKKNENVKPILQSPYAQDFDKITAGFAYDSIEELKNIVDNYGSHFKIDELFAALKCKKLDASHMLKANRTLYPPLVMKYADMVTLKARADFLEGKTVEGLTKIHNFMVFSLDLLSSSTSLSQDRTAMVCFTKTCRELIPLLVSLELNLETKESVPGEDQDMPPTGEQDNTTSGEQEKSTAEEQVAPAGAKPETSPGEEQETPPVRTEDAGPAAPGPEEAEDSQTPLYNQVEELVKKTLDKIEPIEILKKEYRSLGRNYEKIYDRMNPDKFGYYMYGKFNYWNHWFSINRYFFNKGARFYTDLFEELKFSETTRMKSVRIIDFYDKHKTDDNIITPDIPQTCCEMSNARMFGKLVLILLKIREFGLDSKEFADMKATPVFINEFSGKPFEIKESEEGYNILMQDTIKLNLRITGYLEDHKHILQSFGQFDIKSEEQIRALFKSSELK